MSHSACILIDIGGTAIKYGVADFNGNFIYKKEMPTAAKAHGGPGIVSKVKSIIREALSSHADIEYVAISTAGMVDPESCEIIYSMPESIPDYTGVNYRDIIAKEFNLKSYVENDVNCAAMGELWLGAGKGKHSVFCMTVGTSLGGAMICNDNLIHGTSNAAGEIGYMRIEGGTMHELASTTYLVKTYADMIGESIDKVNGKIIFDRAEAGDATAAKAIDLLLEHLTDGISNVICVQNPDMVILGGGIMARSDYMRPKIAALLSKKLRPLVVEATQIEFASLKNDAGMLGALFNLKRRAHIE